MQRTVAFAFIVVLLIAASGCATRPGRVNPDAVYVAGMIIDAKGKDRQKVLQDGGECEGIARETAAGERTVGGAIAGAVVGALWGALVYRATGDSGNAGAAYGAAAGALGGGLGAAASGAQDYKTVLRNCMIGRGHQPLN